MPRQTTAWALCSCCLLALLAAPAAADDKPIHALILTGHDGPFHKWKETSKALKEALENDARFKVRVVEDPEFLANADLLGYDVLVQNYVNWEKPGLSDKAKDGLLKYLKAGKGLAVIHFANGAFHMSLPKSAEGDWPEYRKIVRRVWDHGDKQVGHDAYGKFTVRITAEKHPITEGLKDFETIDELYYRQSGDLPITPLVVAKSKVTGKNEPLAWACEYEKGRVFQTLLGHAAESIRGEGPATLIRRGCVWAAKREQLKEAKPREDGKLSLVEGKFGKALDARKTAATVAGNERWRRPPLTVECWAKLHSKSGFNVLVGSDTKASADHWEIYSYSGSGAFSAYLPGMHPSEIVSKSDICDGQWHYLAMTLDGGIVKLFVDGKPVHEQKVAPKKGATPLPGALTLGMALQSEKERISCDGLIDDLRISSIARKIEGVPSKPLALDQETIGLWRFDSADAADVDPAWTPRPAGPDAPDWQKKSDKDWIDDRLGKMDTGPFFNATFSYPGPKGKEMVYKGTAIKIGEKGEAAVLYDRCQMRFAAGWTDGWLTHSSRRFGLLNTPTPAGSVLLSSLSGRGWADAKQSWKITTPATAPLPREWLKYDGLYLHDKRVTFSFNVNGVPVLESPWVEETNIGPVYTRELEHGDNFNQRLYLDICTMPEQVKVAEWHSKLWEGVRWNDGKLITAVVVHGSGSLRVKDGRLRFISTVSEKGPVRYKLLMWQGKDSDLPRFEGFVDGIGYERPRLAQMRKSAQPRWKPLVTKGELGKSDGPFAIDTLTIPYDNPYKALFFVTGVDALPNGDVALCTAHGDVWTVRGVDEKLEKLTWRRFATGLYQPMGLKVVDGKIIVLERGQLTRLHDLNEDGEADFYENFNNDWHTGGGEHAFDTCLEIGPDGSFYFFKTGDTDTPTGGCLMRLSKDGKKSEIFATGFRHPIGLGMSPTGIITGADQEGNWMPVTRLDVYKKGGFYGDMRAHHRKEPPKTYDPPLCWLPKQMDNSAGGQVWVPEGKWGPLGGKMLHLSYGQCRMMLVLPQKVGEQWQGGAVDLGVQFLAGVKTGVFHPRDGHLYLAGLQGWQTAAVKDGCLQRVRWTGKKLLAPVGMACEKKGIRLTFAEPLDRKLAEDAASWTLDQWNYKWSADYGSKRWSLSNPGKEGEDRVPVKSARLSEDGKSVFLELGEVKPVMQMRIAWRVAAASGERMEGAVYGTIHQAAP